ncbi:MAG TPA: nickel pincer cofactor biosynthesis protein LarC [Acidimicrobiales bacterium]|jgi:hypothetical protein|nr:nickel pincer cofactor biosynthesis protein LarC [Acidimicrobiales bacterium]
MNRVAWFHCFAGIAGDMALASLLDAGADIDDVRSSLERLPFDGWSISSERVLRGGLSATHVEVSVDDDGVARTASDIIAMIRSADLGDRVAERSIAIFDALALAEGAIHGQPPSDVHFHEVGGHDAIIDVVGTVVALELLGVDEVRASAVAVGRGTVEGHHGLLPNPPPAVIELLRGFPVVGREVDLELTTPTGAAILAGLATGSSAMPNFTIESSGFGAGTRPIEGMPNCTQVVIGSVSASTAGGDYGGQPLALVEANLDDATGEQVADTLDALLASGAADAWVTSVLMKKGRPGQVVSALCPLALVGALRDILLTEGGSFGVRMQAVERYASERRIESVDVDGHAVGMKVNGVRAKVEHDDAARAAASLGLTVREVTARATAAYEAERRRIRSPATDTPSRRS